MNSHRRIAERRGINGDPAVAISILVISAYRDQAVPVEGGGHLDNVCRIFVGSRLAFIYLEGERVFELAIGGAYYRRGSGVS